MIVQGLRFRLHIYKVQFTHLQQNNHRPLGRPVLSYVLQIKIPTRSCIQIRQNFSEVKSGRPVLRYSNKISIKNVYSNNVQIRQNVIGTYPRPLLYIYRTKICALFSAYKYIQINIHWTYEQCIRLYAYFCVRRILLCAALSYQVAKNFNNT